jgi:hypothetical protein
MLEGFWIVQYEGMAGNGGGVVLFIEGRVFGGDSGYMYMGSYETQADSVRAQVKVQNFLPNVPSVLGTVGDFELQIDGKVVGDIIKGTGSIPNSKAVGIALKLTKKADLPVS